VAHAARHLPPGSLDYARDDETAPSIREIFTSFGARRAYDLRDLAKETNMPEITKYEPGQFCWIELSTSDADGAKKFYGDLFGWGYNEIPMEPGKPPYIMATKSGKEVGAIYQSPGVPPNWMNYVDVDDVNAAAEKVKSLGGKVHNGPFDVFEAGKMAICADPQGAMFSLWQPGHHIGAGLANEAGTWVWSELWANDTEAAKAFYTALFGWTAKDSPEYVEWQADGKGRGGMFPMKSRGIEGVPPHWLTYFAVDDVDAAVEKATSQGAKAYVPAMDIPNIGRFAALTDPQGAVFAIFKPNM
jgi:predicted enzyme related to lactoylglutathione lyase